MNNITEVNLEAPMIDLKVFAQRYRQALLYAMIEGLNEGAAFSFSDDRDPNAIESELSSAGLRGYRWSRTETSPKGGLAFLIERKSDPTINENCCGCCCAQPKEES